MKKLLKQNYFLNGQLIKNYEGILKPQDFGDVETGISVVIQHLYLHKMSPKGMFGMNYCPDNLFEIIISKNTANEFRIESIKLFHHLS